MARTAHRLAASPRQTSQSKMQTQHRLDHHLVQGYMLDSGWQLALLTMCLVALYGVFYRYGAVWTNATWLGVATALGYVMVWGGWRHQRLARQVWLGAYWHRGSLGQKYLRGGVLMMLRQLLKVFFWLLFLLVGPYLLTELWQWLWFIALSLLVPLVLLVWQKILRQQTNAIFMPLLAWRITWLSMLVVGVATYLVLVVVLTDEAQYANLLDEYFQYSRSRWMASTWLFELYQWISLKAALRWSLGGQLSAIWMSEELRLGWRLVLHLPEVLWWGVWLKLLGCVAFLPRVSTRSENNVSVRAAAIGALMLVGIALIGVFYAHQTQPYVVAIDGRYYVITQQQYSQLEQKMHTFWQEQQAQLVVQANGLASEKVTQLFAKARTRVPAFVDDYYRLGAEYQRMLFAGAYWLSATKDDAQAVALWQRLLPELQDEVWFEALAAETQALETRWLQAALGGWHQELEAWLGQPLADYIKPMGAVETANVLLPKTIDLMQHQFVVRQKISAFAFGAGVASGIGTRLVFKRLVSRQAPSTLLRGLFTRVGASSLLCAPTGVGALGCAALGAGAWFTTDYIALKLEQYHKSEEMQRFIYDLLSQQEKMLQEALMHTKSPVK